MGEKVWLKKAVAAIITMTVLCGVFSQSFSQDLPQDTAREVLREMVPMIENSGFILHVNETTGQFCLENKATGKLWWSTPPDPTADSLASGRNRMELQSNLIIRYANADENEIDLTNSHTGAVVPGTVEVSRRADEVRIAYKMNSIRLYVPLYVRLTEDGIVCTIRTEEIIEGGKYAIYSIAMLPFFGAGYHDESGYLFIPDGSGAIVEFDLKKSRYAPFREPVYGVDQSFDIIRQTAVKEAIRMPVYGIHHGNDSFLGIITEGSGIAQIEASPGGNGTGFSNVYPLFNLRYIGTYYMGQSLGGTTRPINLYDRSPIRKSQIEVKMVFLHGDEGGYFGMAKAYRNHLIATGQLPMFSFASPEIHLELIGSVRKQERFLGIPITVTRTLTDFAKAGQIVEILTQAGVEADRIAINYTDWDRNAIRGVLTGRANPAWGMGGSAGLRKLEQQLQDNGTQLYLDRDFLVADRFGAAFSRTRNAAVSISRKTVSLYQYSYVNYYKRRLVKPSYLVAPASLSRIYEQFLSRFERLGASGISLGRIGDMLYSDFSSMDFNRNDAALEMTQIAATAGENYHVMARGGNAYVFAHTDRILGAPGSSSGFDICDHSVPFYQIVLYGSIRSSSVPVNRSENPRIAMLHAIEYLSSIRFTWIGSDMKELEGTKYEEMGSADYRDWLDLAAEYMKELTDIYELTENTDIREHRIEQTGVRSLIWENGLHIMINYNDTQRMVSGIWLPAEDYKIVESPETKADGTQHD